LVELSTGRIWWAINIFSVPARFALALPPFRSGLKDDFEASEEMRTHTATFNATLQAGYFIRSIRARLGFP
jgi:3-hydroxypropanoate dehydrogenase